jgi:hypothetical protein
MQVTRTGLERTQGRDVPTRIRYDRQGRPLLLALLLAANGGWAAAQPGGLAGWQGVLIGVLLAALLSIPIVRGSRSKI